MMPAISERTEEWRAGLRVETEPMRQLWAAVATAVLHDASTTIHKARRAGDNEKIANAIRRLRAWALSADGREVLSLAGIDHSARVVDLMCDAALRGLPVLHGNYQPKGMKKAEALQ